MVRKNIILLFAVGIILRIILAFSTFHPDIRAFGLGGDLVAQGHIFDLYDYLGTLPKNSDLVRVFGTDLFIYPPLVYFLDGIFAFVWNFIFPPFHFYSTTIGNLPGNPLFNIYLFLLKIPNFIFDILTAIYLMKLFDSPRKKYLAAAFWLFNPVTLYTTFMMGQFDIMATFFVVLSLYYIKKDKLSYAALALGFGIAFKLFPIFLVPVLLMLVNKNWERIKLGVISLLPYLISVLMFLPSHGFRSSALVAGQTLKSFYAQIAISGGESIVLFPLFLIIFYLVVWNFPPKFQDIWKYFSVPLFLFFIFTHYHPQWFLWLSPFLIMMILLEKKVNEAVGLMIVSFLGLLFFFDPTLTVNIFAPIFPGLKGLPSVWELLHINIDQNFSRSLLQTLFCASAFYVIYLSFFKNSDE